MNRSSSAPTSSSPPAPESSSPSDARIPIRFIATPLTAAVKLDDN